MGYTKTDFGTMKDGRKVYRYTLTNENGVSASFTDLGGTWLTMVVPDRDGNMADVVLGYDTVETIQGTHRGDRGKVCQPHRRSGLYPQRKDV